MFYNDLEKGFQAAFDSAWNAYKEGSTPIGAAILNENNKVISIGQNSIYSQNNRQIIENHHLAHAEVNAILQVNGNIHPNIKNYTIYTTMEPCPFCFGAIVMGRIRHLKFAARDKYAGATCLNTSMNYIIKENIIVEGPHELLEIIQIALSICRRLDRGFLHNDTFFNMYQSYSPKGCEIGKRLYYEKSLSKMINNNCTSQEVYNYILSLCN
jgi:tRNA(Arg) A34 adenosine deaminase TadA